ncbi:hypothetical protein VC83_03179 [Pseudogymnoascus destructans]|uniref:Uncharacterized protein n=1 Tax=Pseudogymnoascus destructans TaxID=655981 RepID=A0A177AEJ2_9PEZI|nr:uncharacterized protein VC83_03179 [Pseudogymnoascus destructans]OAF60230.1 hypothetical protein VC83_03179 [Pseudogymnoascus destructans]
MEFLMEVAEARNKIRLLAGVKEAWEKDDGEDEEANEAEDVKMEDGGEDEDEEVFCEDVEGGTFDDVFGSTEDQEMGA